MKTKIIKIECGRLDEGPLHLVAKTLLSGGVMAYPTETFYGLGAVSVSEKAIRKIYRLKKRDTGKPLPLIVSNLEMAAMLSSELPPAFFSLAEEFWPGPLTLILKAVATFPEEAAGPGRTVAVRIPPLSWLRNLVDEIGFPITATSANISGRGGISDAADIIEMFDRKVDLIVDGGKTAGTAPSTIVDLSCEKPCIIREGMISASRLAGFL